MNLNDSSVPISTLAFQVQGDDAQLRDATLLQRKLFPLHAVTLPEFKSNARVHSSSSNSEINGRLMWRVMAEDLSEEQVILFTQFCMFEVLHRHASNCLFIVDVVWFLLGGQRVLFCDKLPHSRGGYQKCENCFRIKRPCQQPLAQSFHMRVRCYFISIHCSVNVCL